MITYKKMIDVNERWRDCKIGDYIKVPLCDKNGCRKVDGKIIKDEIEKIKIEQEVEGIERRILTIEINS